MFQSVPHMLLNTIENYPDNDALRYFKNEKICSYTYKEMGDNIETVTNGLASLGLKEGNTIAILSNNRPEWPICDFAIFSLKGITVPIYQTLPPNQIEFILQDSETAAIFVEDSEQLKKILSIKNNLPALKHIIIFEDESKDPSVMTYRQLLESGKKHLESHPDFYRKTVDSINPDDLCSLVYTSGTTGTPKGVMLHHRGFLHDIINSEAVFNLYPDDVFLSFLPLSHLYERLGGHWCPMYRGATIHYARGIDKVVEDLSVAKPTVMVSVPRLYEKIATAVLDKVEAGPYIKKKMFYGALKLGLKYHQDKAEGKDTLWQNKMYRLADKVVFSQIKQKLGGRFRFPISGGAPLPVETLKFFEAIGLQLIEGYGMTETHLIITLTPVGKSKYGSCGKPIEGVEVKISQEGEILVRGATLMKGYFKRPELTAEVIDEEGWLHTGDIGYLDDENYLFITDRIKNIIVTSGGKNVASAPLENRLKTSRYIDDACLIGNNRKFISALIIPNKDNLGQWAEQNSIKYADENELCNKPEVKELLHKEIEDLQKEFARFEKVKKFIILSEPLSIEKGELTPSLKIRRNIVEKNYKELIDKLYQED